MTPRIYLGSAERCLLLFSRNFLEILPINLSFYRLCSQTLIQVDLEILQRLIPIQNEAFIQAKLTNQLEIFQTYLNN